MIKNYLLQNWALILILLAFAITLFTNIFLDKTTTRRLYVLIVGTFLLSISVFVEFYFAEQLIYSKARIVLMAIRYSATPFIIAQVIFTLAKRLRWFIFIPAMALGVLNIVSIFTGIVFMVSDDGTFTRGPLGFIPFIVAGVYCILLIYILLKNSNKQAMEIIPIVFMAGALGTGLIFPFVFGSDFSQIFCTTIAIALFVYYVFLILQITKKDPLTGLLNRQAYYADVERNPEDITALLSIDMNGLKAINDNEGHAAGDEAISTVSHCFSRSLKRRQSGYRVGGDEFIIVCRKNTMNDVNHLVERIRTYVSQTKYSCSIGYSFAIEGNKSVEELLKQSDELMYAEKARYYKNMGIDRRRR